jgi:hypothetical protein
MLRKLFSLGALVVVAVTFGVSSAAAKPDKPKPAGTASGEQRGGAYWSDGFSDGRFQH